MSAPVGPFCSRCGFSLSAEEVAAAEAGFTGDKEASEFQIFMESQVCEPCKELDAHASDRHPAHPDGR